MKRAYRWYQPFVRVVVTMTQVTYFSPASAQIDMLPSGQPTVLFRWESSSCEADITPDAPARAFRRDDGMVVLLATHYVNWALVGKTLLSVIPNCEAVMRSSNYEAQKLGKMWIEAVHTVDGHEVSALLSQDLTAKVISSGCNPVQGPGYCWLNNIRSGYSRDGGRTFMPYFGFEGIVATINHEYELSDIKRQGFFTTSNIATVNSRSYFFGWGQHKGVQAAGNCLFRSDAPLDPSSWRAWDGAQFAIRMNVVAESYQPCKVIGGDALGSEVRSLSYVPSAATWIAITVRPNPPGVYVSQSRDLFNWSPARLLLTAHVGGPTSNERQTLQYPSLLDPDSNSRNFDTIDSDHPVLVYGIRNFGRLGWLPKGGALNRELIYQPLKIRLTNPP